MNMNQWTPVLVASILAIGTVQAFADSGWSYDEDSDTIIFSNNGSPESQPVSRSEDETLEQTGAWYYDESSDTIVINSEGSRDQYVRSNPSTDISYFDFNLAFLDQ